MSKVSQALVATGQFCTVTFIKNDGTVRTINGRTGVKKYVKGNGTRSQSTDNKYFLLWTREGSNKFNAPKNINRGSIVSVKAHGIAAQRNNQSVYADYV